MLQDLGDGALGHDLAPEPAGPRAQVDDVIRRADGVLVVLHHDHGVAQVAQVPEGGEQPLVVPLVQPDAGLVQDVEHADEPGADLGREPDPLGLAAGQRARRAAQGEVVEPDVAQEAQPVTDFLEDRAGDLGVEPLGAAVHADRQPREELVGPRHRQVHDVADALAAHVH